MSCSWEGLQPQSCPWVTWTSWAMLGGGTEGWGRNWSDAVLAVNLSGAQLHLRFQGLCAQEPGDKL